MGVDLSLVSGSGPRSRISKDDIKSYVKSVLQGEKAAPKAAASSVAGSGIPPIPEIDYSKKN